MAPWQAVSVRAARSSLKAPQVEGEGVDGLLVGHVCQVGADLPLQGREDEPGPGVLRHLPQQGLVGMFGVGALPEDEGGAVPVPRLYGDF